MRRKRRLTKEEKGVMSFWLPVKLKDRFHHACEKCKFVKEHILGQLIQDFCDGVIYDLPQFKPVSRKALVHYKGEDGKWIYITGEEFIERVAKKTPGGVPGDKGEPDE